VAAQREARRVVTVLFCDVTGSTALGERLDPEALRTVMAGYFAAMRSAIERHGGTVEKFIGDAVMAVFGLPNLHEDDAMRAVRAAVEMRAELERLRIPARIGINTGEVVVGGDALVTGDAVNVAARLEQAAASGEVLIGESTYRLVRDAVRTAAVAPVNAKGKAAPVHARRLLHAETTGDGMTRRMDVPLVGRAAELTLLRQTYERAVRERRVHLFTLLGVAGAGKSRLIAELAAGLQPDATVLTGHCLSYGEGITFWPLAEVVRAAAAIAEEDTATRAREKLHGLLARRGSGDANAIADRIGRAIGLDAPATGADEIAWAARRLLELLAAEGPLVIMLEDLHWAEAMLLDLIETIADLSRGASILLVCSARPELLDVRPHWGGGKANATSIMLEPLTDEDARRMIATRLDAERLGARDREQIVSAAEGNPLFVEQMLATLTDGSASHELVVPGTIQALLAARLEGLGAAERAVLETAAVEGRVFHRSAVAALAVPTPPDLARLLSSLVRRELISPDRTGFGSDEAFRFQHQLIRDAAYAQMSKRTRAETHERFAEWLEQRVGERAAEYEEIVGYHLEQACRLRAELDGGAAAAGSAAATRAGRLLASAGRRARDRGDARSAAGLLTRASVLLLEPLAERCELLLDLSRAHMWNGDVGDSAEAARQGRLLATGLHDPRIEARAEIACLYAVDEPRDGDPDGAADALIERLTALGDDPGLALAWEIKFGVAQEQMHAAAAIAAAQQTIAYARRSGQRTLEIEMLLEVAGQSLWGPTPVADAIDRCRDVLEAAGDDPRREAKVTAIIAALEAMRGNLAAARASRTRAAAIDAQLGSGLDACFQAQHWAIVDRLGDDHPAAEDVLRRSLERLDPSASVHAINRDMLAHVLVAQGRFEEADELAGRSERSAGMPSEAFGADWRRVRARVLAHGGRYADAVRLADEASELMATTDYLDDRAGTERDRALVLRAAGRHADAVGAAQSAVTLWDQKGNVISAARARAEFGLA
jgi:predicted ATPase/class 3 adenylate cyclase